MADIPKPRDWDPERNERNEIALAEATYILEKYFGDISRFKSLKAVYEDWRPIVDDER